MPRGFRKKTGNSKPVLKKLTTARLQKKIAKKEIEKHKNEIKILIHKVIMNRHIIYSVEGIIQKIENHFSHLLKRFSNSLDIISEDIFSLIEFINQRLNHCNDYYCQPQEVMINETEFTKSHHELCRHALIMALIRPCIIKTDCLRVDVFSTQNVNKIITLCQSVLEEAHFIIKKIYAGFLWNIISYQSSLVLPKQSAQSMIFTTTVKFRRLAVYFHFLSNVFLMSKRYNKRLGKNTFIIKHNDTYHTFFTMYKCLSLYSVLPQPELHVDNKQFDLKVNQKLAKELQPKVFNALKYSFSTSCDILKAKKDDIQLKKIQSEYKLVLQASSDKYQSLHNRLELYCPNFELIYYTKVIEYKEVDLEKPDDKKIPTLSNKNITSSNENVSCVEFANQVYSFPKMIKSLNLEQIKLYIDKFEKLLIDPPNASNGIIPTISAVIQSNIEIGKDYLKKCEHDKNQHRKERRKKNRKAKRAINEKNNLIASENKRILALEQSQSKKVTHQSLAAYQTIKPDVKSIEAPWCIAIVQPVDKKTVGRQLDILQTYRYRFSHQFMQQKYYQIWQLLFDTHLSDCIIEVTQNVLTLMLISLSKFKIKHELTDGDLKKIDRQFRVIDEIISNTLKLDVNGCSEMIVILKLAQSRRLIIDAEIRLKYSHSQDKNIEDLLKEATTAIKSIKLIPKTQSQAYDDETTETLNDIESIRSRIIKRKTISKPKYPIISADVKTIEKPYCKNRVHVLTEIDKEQSKLTHHSIQFSQIWIYQRAIRTHGHLAILQHAKNLQQKLQILQSALQNSTLAQIKSVYIQSFCSKLNTLILKYGRVLGKTLNTSAPLQVRESTLSINQVLQSLQEILAKGYITTEHELVNASLPCLMCDNSILIEKQLKLIQNFNSFLKTALNKNGLTEKDAAFYITGSTLDKFHPNFKTQIRSDDAIPDLDLTICLWTSTAHNKLKQVVTDFKKQLPKKVAHAFIYSTHLNMHQCHNVSIDGIDIDLTIKCAKKGQEHSNTFEHELVFNITEQTLSLTNKSVSYLEVFTKASNSEFDISEITASKFEPYTVAFVIKKSIQYISKYGLSPGSRTRKYFGTIVSNNYLLSKTIKLLLDKYVHKNGNIKVYHALLQYPLPITFGNIEYAVSLSYIINLWLPPSQPIATIAYQSPMSASSDTKSQSEIRHASIINNNTYDIKQDALRHPRR